MTIKRTSSDEKNLALSLIAAAFAFMAAAIFAGSNYFDKLKTTPLALGSGIGLLGIGALVGSVIAGGRGIAYGRKQGPGNAFDVQAKLGLSGVVLLCLAAMVFMFGPRAAQSPSERQTPEDAQRISSMENEVFALRHRMDKIEDAVNSSKEIPQRTSQELQQKTPVTPRPVQNAVER